MQREIYHWYVIFEVAFILFATVIGTTTSDWVMQWWDGKLSEWIVEFVRALFAKDKGVHLQLAKALPESTNWYTQFIVSQSAIHCMDLTRYINLAKFLLLRMVYDTDKAREYSEPEDQDYYGLGSRSARWMTNMWIGIMFCQISPLTSFFVFVNFVVCKVVYGYLVLYAETRKPDMGGTLWERMLWDLQISLLLYVILMVGCFELNHQQTRTWWPSIIAMLSLIPWGRSFYKFTTIPWKCLPYEELVKTNTEEAGDQWQEAYIQPELVNRDDELSGSETGEGCTPVARRLSLESSSSDSSSDESSIGCRC